jgi:type I restriction enzyme S subunit
MGVKPCYKQTEVGVIPEDWHVTILQDACRTAITYGIVQCGPHIRNGVPYIRVSDMDTPELDVTRMLRTAPTIAARFSRSTVQKGDLVYALRGKLGEVRRVRGDVAGANLTQGTARIAPKEWISGDYLLWALRSSRLVKQAEVEAKGTTFREITLANLRRLSVPVPPTNAEQLAIADALIDVERLLGGLDRLLAKKRDLKQAAMQQLLTGQTRLPSFSGEWVVKTLEHSADCLDGVRIPLNETQRAAMQGDYPYCGANGVLDYVDSYVIDDDIILMAEDGGYFDEYESRPIAYRMKGKCWVNNHAHVLKAKSGFDQGFLFYSLVHKNILPFLSSGTRAKLNKSELNKVEVRFPHDVSEQTAIAEVLSDMDAEIAMLEQQREKTRALKQAMMQVLLTGKTRLVKPEAAHA